jgi:hypothetical protein
MCCAASERETVGATVNGSVLIHMPTIMMASR